MISSQAHFPNEIENIMRAKNLFQIVDATTGMRSPLFNLTFHEMSKALQDFADDTDSSVDGESVLFTLEQNAVIHMGHIEDNGQVSFRRLYPVVSAKTFIDHFPVAEKNEVTNNG